MQHLHISSLIKRALTAATIIVMASATAMAQDDLDVKIKTVVVNKNETKRQAVEYTVFNTMKRAKKAMNELKTAVTAEEKVTSLGGEIQATMDATGTEWKESRANGEIDNELFMPGQVVLIFSNKREVALLEIQKGKTEYIVRIEDKQTLREVDVVGKRRNDAPNIKKVPSMDTGYMTSFNINYAMPEGYARNNSRLIIQPMAIDCQTEDTVAYLTPFVYEGAAYHRLQDKRMAFNYLKNDPVASGYKSAPELCTGQPFEMSENVQFKKPDKEKIYRGAYDIVLEDYHHVIHTDGKGSGSCLTIRPYKFLDFAVAKADMPLADEFKEPAKKSRSSVPRDLALRFVVNEAKLMKDSANDAAMEELMKELRSYGMRLQKVKIDGAASPEGNYEHNYKLAAQRAKEALAIIERGLRSYDVQLPEPTVTVHKWTDVPAELEKMGLDNEAQIVSKTLADTDEKQWPTAMMALPFYNTSIKGPNGALERLRTMKCSYSYVDERVLSADEVAAAYMANKEDYLSGKKTFSDGDFYNLFNFVRDSAELDTLTIIAYRSNRKQAGFENLPFSPYIANRMALLNMRRGVPDTTVLAPFIDIYKSAIPYTKMRTGSRAVLVNRAEMVINQAIIYFMDQKLDMAGYFIEWITKKRPDKSQFTATLEKFINFQRYFTMKIYGMDMTPEQQRLCNEAYNFVVEHNDNNKAIIYAELHSQMDKTRAEAEEWVNKMADSNPKKWYLKGILWSDEAGQEPAAANAPTFKELSDMELAKLQREDPAAAIKYYDELEKHTAAQLKAGSNKTPHFLAYFQHSFDMEPKYLRLYANEGNVSDETRKKYPYDKDKANEYREKFNMIAAPQAPETTEQAPVERQAASNIKADATEQTQPTTETEQ